MPVSLTDWHYTDWGVLLLFGGGICLSNILKTTETSAFLATALSQIVADLGIVLVVMLVTAFVVFLTEFVSNTALSALFIPLFASVAEAFGMSPIMLSVLIALAASCAFMMPVATPPNAIVFGTGKIKQNEMMRVGFILNVVCIAILTAIAILIW
ncbi:hypothetical protein BIY21_15945 [Vibrio ponticus]|uniref:Di-and tricarboxylate transporter n=1 Tax=Vibrio ponticus TaxID=265668 RepID=A0ABX3FAZ3_9VIBR|nr:hypothetical protein BIY21_15945 [Vibrio ponticus]